MFIRSQVNLIQLLFAMQVVVSTNSKSFYEQNYSTYLCSKDIFLLRTIEHLNKDPSNWTVLFIDEEFSLLENYNQFMEIINQEKTVRIVQLPIKDE